MNKHRLSLYACLISGALIAASTLFYYPKWEKSGTEAAISWDVSGYYLYLPAIFIYHDVKTLAWWGEIDKKYHPGPGMGQAFHHPSGNYVMKYSMGQALQFLPWFLTAHALAEPLGYPADGFSRPYQVAVGWGSLLIAFLGLWFLRRILLKYFSDGISAAVILSLAFGSNYLEYAGITGAMTHNWLFTLYCLLIYATIRFYRNPSYGTAALIGLLVGWAALTRPTEIISALIPLLWGVGSREALKQRLAFFKTHIPKLVLSAGAAGAMMLLQAVYWKYAAGEWIVYSYEDQGFTWFPPHIEDVLWSAKAGWLVYSPLMLFAVAGLFLLRRRTPDVFPAVLIYCLAALYITAAWDIWWYGGSLGQRAMVQAYPLWAFCLAAFWSWVSERDWRSWVFIPLAGVCIYLNLWWSHQAHRGGLFMAEQMTRRYMLNVLGRFEVDRDCMKYLDTRDQFTGSDRQSVQNVLTEDFEKDSSAVSEAPLAGTRSLVLDKDRQFSREFVLPVLPQSKQWVRASATFKCSAKEWDWWKMTQFAIRFRQGDKIVKERFIRLQRLVESSEMKTVFFDTQAPSKPFDRVSVLFWNAGGEKPVQIDDLKVEIFE